MSESPVLILGIGNLLLSDEGVGIHAVRQLERMALPDGIAVLDGGTGGFHLLEALAQPSAVILIDAALGEDPPGTVRVRRPRFPSDFPRVLSAHDIGLRDLLESASLLGPLPRMVLITVSVSAEQPMGLTLSPPIQAAVPEVVRRALDLAEEEAGGSGRPPGL